MADVRRRRRRPDRGGDGRADRRAVPPGPAAQLPADRSPTGPGPPARRGRRRPDPVRGAALPMTARDLGRLGVEVHTGAMVVGMDGQTVDVRRRDDTTTTIDARTKVWAAGMTASPLGRLLVDASGAETDRAGRVRVNPDCSLPGHSEVFVVGDLMTLDDLPAMAEVAMQSGRPRGDADQAAARRRPHRPAVPLPGPREPGRDLPVPGGRQDRPGVDRRLRRLAPLARRPPDVPDRFQEPARRARPLGHQLRRA